MTVYACHNRPPFAQATELHDHHGRLVSSWPAHMAPECQYTKTELGQVDVRCVGCGHRLSITEGSHDGA